MRSESRGARPLRSLIGGQILNCVANGLRKAPRRADHGSLGFNNLDNALITPTDRLTVNGCRHSSGLSFNGAKSKRSLTSGVVTLRAKCINLLSGETSNNM